MTFSFFIEEPAPGNDHESDDARPNKRILRKRKEKRIDDQAITNVDLAQKFGVLSIGEAVCRDFGTDGIFYGTINAYRRETTGELYTVRYSDGDQEDLDTEEYNFAYALWLTQEGWNAEEGDDVSEDGYIDDDDEPTPKLKQSPKKVFVCVSYLTVHFQLQTDILAPTQQAKVKNAMKTKAKIEEVINLTTKKSIAGQHISIMSTSEREDVVNKLTKTAKTNENKHVKSAVLAVAYDNLCQSAFLEHLQGLQGPVSHMVHPKQRSLKKSMICSHK